MLPPFLLPIKLKHLLIAGLLFGMAGCATGKKMATPALALKKEGVQKPKNSPLLTRLLAQYPQYFDSLLGPDRPWHIQIIYTHIDRKAGRQPVFTHHYFQVDRDQYYYPASTVKLPVVALALQKLNELAISGLDRHTTMVTLKGAEDESEVYNDPSSADGRPTVEQYIKKILLVSDNDAFNRLYEFLGQDYINDCLHGMGYDSAAIWHRLNIPLTEAQNRLTNPVQFYDTAGRLLYQQPLVKSHMAYPSRTTLLGKGYYSNGRLIHAPFDFSKKNRLSLVDLHSILLSIIFPDAVPKKQRFHIKDDDYRFLWRYMSLLPQQSDFPQYDSLYNDAYVKFLLYGGHDLVDSHIRIFNKAGEAYGFLTDAAYIVDSTHHIEFALSATIHCNSDGIYNDDHYDYETIGLPFMKHLGQVIYQYELAIPSNSSGRERLRGTSNK